eukprot:365111-Chlamydomonas_euryale.AAC.7
MSALLQDKTTRQEECFKNCNHPTTHGCRRFQPARFRHTHLFNIWRRAHHGGGGHPLDDLNHEQLGRAQREAHGQRRGAARSVDAVCARSVVDLEAAAAAVAAAAGAPGGLAAAGGRRELRLVMGEGSDGGVGVVWRGCKAVEVSSAREFLQILTSPHPTYSPPKAPPVMTAALLKHWAAQQSRGKHAMKTKDTHLTLIAAAAAAAVGAGFGPLLVAVAVASAAARERRTLQPLCDVRLLFVRCVVRRRLAAAASKAQLALTEVLARRTEVWSASVGIMSVRTATSPRPPAKRSLPLWRSWRVGRRCGAKMWGLRVLGRSPRHRRQQSAACPCGGRGASDGGVEQKCWDSRMRGRPPCPGHQQKSYFHRLTRRGRSVSKVHRSRTLFPFNLPRLVFQNVSIAPTLPRAWLFDNLTVQKAVPEQAAGLVASLAPETRKQNAGERRGPSRKMSPEDSTISPRSSGFGQRQWQLAAGQFVWTSADRRGIGPMKTAPKILLPCRSCGAQAWHTSVGGQVCSRELQGAGVGHECGGPGVQQRIGPFIC